MLKKAEYARKGASIKNLVTEEIVGYESINAAKRDSRKLQNDIDAMLGRGTVKAVSNRSPSKTNKSRKIA